MLHCVTLCELTIDRQIGGAGVMPIYWTSRAVIHVLVLTVETTAFTTRKAVYYTVGTRVSPVHHFGKTTMY